MVRNRMSPTQYEAGEGCSRGEEMADGGRRKAEVEKEEREIGMN